MDSVQKIDVKDKTGRVLSNNEIAYIIRQAKKQTAVDKNDKKDTKGYHSFLFINSKIHDAYDILVKEGDKYRGELQMALQVGTGQMNMVVSGLLEREDVEHKKLRKFHIIKTLDEALK